MLAEFASMVDLVQRAVAVQEIFKKRIFDARCSAGLK